LALLGTLVVFLSLYVSEEPLILVRESLDGLCVCALARLVRLKLLHQLLGRGDRLVESFPNLLRFVHKGVFFRDLSPGYDFLAREDFLVSVCQLEHLVLYFLLRGLVPLELADHLSVFQELRQDFWLPPDKVDVWRVLWLPLVQELKDFALGIPTHTRSARTLKAGPKDWLKLTRWRRC